MVMTQEIIDKEYIFSMGGTDEEACLCAGISTQALYDYQKRHPEFAERKGCSNPTSFSKPV